MASDGYGYIIFSNEGLGSGGSANMQSKTITPTKNTQVATPDVGYDGLSKVTVNPIPSNYIVPTGTTTITTNGTHDVAAYASARVSISSDAPELQSKEVSYTPSETAQSQTVSPDSGYDGLTSVKVNVGAISSTYVGSDIARRTADNLTANGASITAAAGYYSTAVSKSVAAGTAGTPTATKGTVSNHTISVTPSVTNTTGYITGGTKNGTAVTVSASELVSGNKAITENGTGIDVKNYATVSVDVEGGPDIPIFTSDDNATYITCNKTYAECRALIAAQDRRAFLNVGSSMQSVLTARNLSGVDGEPLSYFYMFNGIPRIQVNYTSDGTLTISNEPDTLLSKTITSNGTYQASGDYVWDEVVVNVPTGGSSTPTLQSKSATPTESAQTITPDSGYDGLSQVSVGAISSTYVGSGITQRSSSDLTASGATVTAPAGYYASDASKTMNLISISESSEPSGELWNTIRATSDMTYINISKGYNTTARYARIFAYLQSKTVTPTESEQVINADSSFDGLSNVTVAAIPSDYVGSDITTDPTPTASGATVTIPEGYYSEQTTKSVASGTAGTPTASKGTVSNHAISVTPSVTNTTGYITGGTKNGTAVTVSASELVSGNKAISESGTDIDVTNYATVSVAAGSATTPATTITANPSISVNSSGLITATASASQSVTPTVSAGYVSSGTAGTVSVSGSKTQQLTTLGATTYNTSTTDQTISSGRYITGTQTIKAVTVSGLSAANIASGVTVKVGDANDDDRIASVTGTLEFVTYYTGTSAPSSSLGNVGDIYLQTS